MKTEEDIPQSKTGRIKSISIIWLVPVVALFIGSWMLYFQLSNRGDLVTIEFENGEGIEAGKTKIKVKNVEVGLVKKVELNETLDGVIVSARIHNKNKNMLVEDSNFWVVRPKIAKGGISGLGTLVSGAYIELAPGISEQENYSFSGLENEPVTPAGSPGLHITLASSGEHALQVGDDILFHGVKVGRIEYVHFNTVERIVYYNAFVESPYDELITTNTRFWEVNGFEVNVSADGIQVQTGTLETLISGGVMFDVPAGMPRGDVVTQRKEFTVFSNKAEIDSSRYQQGLPYILLFKGTIRGLKFGASVEYHGVKIGRVARTDIAYPQMGHLLDPNSAIPVMITIDPTRIGYKNDEPSWAQAKQDILSLLKKGLHGRIETGSFVTGSKYIALQYDGGITKTLKHFGDYVVIPTLGDELETVINRFSELLNKINRLPLKKIVNTTDTTMQQATTTLSEVALASRQLKKLLKQSTDQDLVANINAVLMNIKKLSADYSAGSPNSEGLNNTLRAMHDTLNELKPLLMQLNQNPNSLIFGNQLKEDIEPKGRQD